MNPHSELFITQIADWGLNSQRGFSIMRGWGAPLPAILAKCCEKKVPVRFSYGASQVFRSPMVGHRQRAPSCVSRALICSWCAAGHEGELGFGHLNARGRAFLEFIEFLPLVLSETADTALFSKWTAFGPRNPTGLSNAVLIVFRTDILFAKQNGR